MDAKDSIGGAPVDWSNMDIYDIQEIVDWPYGAETTIQVEEETQLSVTILTEATYPSFVTHFAEVWDAFSDELVFPDEGKEKYASGGWNSCARYRMRTTSFVQGGSL